MSAIWGMVDFCYDSANEDLVNLMEEPYHTYKIDQFSHYFASNVLFGYGAQYFTEEAKKEKQPIVNLEETEFFLADAVLDNRDDLLNLLNISEEERNEIPDGLLMYRVFSVYGRHSLNMFLGTYTFVSYSKATGEIMLASDAVGSRCLYYKLENDKMYFSTLIKPIRESCKRRPDWNYRYLSDYLAINNVSHGVEIEETPYQNIYKLAPGQIVTFDGKKISKEDYWRPTFKISKQFKKDDIVKKEVVTLFRKCVDASLRSSAKTGILLSGGLDSTSVACFAASRLKEKGEQLYSYTSIPERDYVSEEIPYYNTNERNMVEITKDFLGNVCCSYLELSGVNGFDGAAEFMERYELPYKSLQNYRWLHECAEQAAKDGCRLMLSGQYGNETISYGDFTEYFMTLLRRGHFIKLAQEINIFHSKNRISRKRIYQYLIKSDILDLIHIPLKAPDQFEFVYVKPELLDEFDTKSRFMKIRPKDHKRVRSFYDMRKKHMFDKRALVQIGEFETRLSLVTGVLMRDPTRDRRLIEFCLKLPPEQFVAKGIDRRLVKEYFRDYLPDRIMDCKYKGLQSADFINRLNKNWKNIYQECIQLLGNEMAEKLLDLPKICRMIEKQEDKISATDCFEISTLLYSVLLVRYIST